MAKVVLNPKHFHVRAKAEDGTIWLTHEKYMEPIRPIKDVTSDILLALCADFSAHDQTAAKAEREIRFNDGWACKVTVEMVKENINGEV